MNEEINVMNLGAVDQKEKRSDFKLDQLASATTTTRPEEYETPYTGTIYHQHKIPACGSHAGCYIKNIQEGRDHSPAYLWKRIKQTDGYAPEMGTSMEAIFKTLHDFGVCSLDLMPNDTLQTLAKYTDPSVITPEMDADAAKSKIGIYAYDWKPTFEKLKQYIYDFKVIIVRIEISADWWTPSWRAEDILPLGTIYDGQGGHFVVLNGYTKDTLKGINEWGVTWGDNGRFYFKDKYMGRVTYIGTCFDYVEKAPLIFTRTLRIGMSGTDVGVLQKVLKDKGFFSEGQKITSFFWTKTRTAVQQFQKSRGLKADGIVGEKTIAELQK